MAVLWNACPNLAFIGLAGVSTGMLPEELFDETEMGLNVNGGGGNSAALWATLKRHDVSNPDNC